MLRIRCFSLVAAALFAAPLSLSAERADEPKVPDEVKKEAASVDAIMAQAVKNIGRRYNLNEAQLEKTHEIMQREVYRFLQQHEEKIWPLIRELLDANLGLTPPSDKDLAKRVGQGALPILEAAKEAILRGNEEWRMYLDESQKPMHDYDLQEMEKTFGQIEQNFEKWAGGNPGPIFPPPPDPTTSPARPPKPLPGLPEAGVVEVVFNVRKLFDSYVEEFIKRYDLSPGQIDTARSILKDYRQKALTFRDANVKELAAIAKEWKKAQEAGNREKLREAESKRKDLLKDVYVLFAQMDDRLNAILTTSQRTRSARANGQEEARPAPQRPRPAKSDTSEEKDDSGR